jgi:hypothetical protein
MNVSSILKGILLDQHIRSYNKQKVIIAIKSNHFQVKIGWNETEPGRISPTRNEKICSNQIGDSSCDVTTQVFFLQNNSQVCCTLITKGYLHAMTSLGIPIEAVRG